MDGGNDIGWTRQTPALPTWHFKRRTFSCFPRETVADLQSRRDGGGREKQFVVRFLVDYDDVDDGECGRRCGRGLGRGGRIAMDVDDACL